MPAHIREYQRAHSVEHALALLERETIETAPLVPGPRMPDDGFPSAAALVDLQELPWDYISREPAILRIGGGTRLQTLVENATVRGVANGVIAEAAALAAPRTLRNLATLAGALDGVADGPPELMLALLALDAQTTVQGAPMSSTALRGYQPSSKTLLVEVAIGVSASASAALMRVARTPLDQAIVAAVGAVVGQTARVAVAGASPLPLVVETVVDDAPAAVSARLAAAVTEAAAPVGDYRGSVEYRRSMAEVLARRAVDAAFAKGASA
ncbi:MAG: FAD binding domain-containing protein [Caldilinea sp.]